MLKDLIKPGKVESKCREPAREIPPMTRSCRRVLISKASGLDGPHGPAQASTPKPESVLVFYVFHQLYENEFEQAPGVADGQGDLVCCTPRGCKDSDMTVRLN